MPITLVPAPIGNLGDITLRGLEVLRTVDRIDHHHKLHLHSHWPDNNPRHFVYSTMRLNLTTLLFLLLPLAAFTQQAESTADSCNALQNSLHNLNTAQINTFAGEASLKYPELFELGVPDDATLFSAAADQPFRMDLLIYSLPPNVGDNSNDLHEWVSSGFLKRIVNQDTSEAKLLDAENKTISGYKALYSKTISQRKALLAKNRNLNRFLHFSIADRIYFMQLVVPSNREACTEKLWHVLSESLELPK